MSLRARIRAPYLVLTALLGLIAGVAGVAPAQAVPSAPQTWTVLVGEESHDMAIQGMAFLPSDITVNAGDTIVFKANSAEIHTVSFGTPPLPPTSIENLLADAVPPAGGPVFDPTEWTNSGILSTEGTAEFPTYTSFSLTFATPGDFDFFCLIHLATMRGSVHVNPAGTPYPHSQKYYDNRATVETAQIIGHGHDLWDYWKAQASPTHVYVGAADASVMIMRFIPSSDTVPAGTTVTFDMGANQVLVPHTVTFSALQQGGTIVDSGLMLPPQTFDVTFDQVGNWTYECELHDEMGMVGAVRVTP